MSFFGDRFLGVGRVPGRVTRLVNFLVVLIYVIFWHVCNCQMSWHKMLFSEI